MKEILIKMLDAFILQDEISSIKEEKLHAITQQQYELGAKLRESEIELSKKLPDTATLKQWRKQLIDSE